METPSLWRNLLKVFLWLAALALVSGAGAFWYWGGQIESSHGTKKETAVFEVAKGEGASTVAQRLEEEGIIGDKLSFLYYLMRSKLQDKIQSGSYELTGAMTIPEIADRLVEGKVIPPGIKITFPEGFTARMMADRLTAAGLPGEQFLDIVMKPFPKWQERFSFLASLPDGGTFEGFLFPDTYIFPKQATAELIVNELLKTFEKKAWPLFTTHQGKTKLTAYQSLILASILEEEGKNFAERKIISDIFLKRLAINQPLQSDATVNYVLGTSKMQPSLQDTDTDSPYNTYKYAGLPPGPIANPGVESITAALDPTPNDYYYFLNNLTTGETVFSRTFEEHVANRQKHGL